MIGTFHDLAHAAPHEARAKLNAVLFETFAEVEALVPTDEGDSRRPAGALRSTGHARHEEAGSAPGDAWAGTITNYMAPTKELQAEIDRIVGDYWADEPGEVT
jgi:hypothetical protein